MPTLILPSAEAWTRHPRRAVLTGTCAALAAVLEISPALLRGACAISAVLTCTLLPVIAVEDLSYPGHIGVTRGMLLLAAAPLVAYVLAWATLPGDDALQRRRAMAAVLSPIAGRPAQSANAPLAGARPQPLLLLRWLCLAAASGLVVAVLVMGAFGPAMAAISSWYGIALHLLAFCLAVPAAGLVLGLLPLSLLDAARTEGAARVPLPAIAALALALAALALGALAVVGVSFGPGAMIGTAIVIAGTALLASLLVIPWGRHLWRAVREEAGERALVQQRSEFTAHLHDSVLQTLTVLQRPGTEPATVRHLARQQERELRRWLYRAGAAEPGAPEDLRGAVEALAAELEDLHGMDVHAVVVGDAPVTEDLRPLLAALREAASNACRHGRDGVDLFVDVDAARVEAFVRDRGPGFDLDSVPPDRLGVRESIIGRMRRAGGSAQVHPGPGGGTEVALLLPRGRRTA